MRVLFVLLCVLGAAPVAGETGVISFNTVGSLERSGGRFVPAEAPVKLTGELLLPAGTGPFPVVVLAHGCNGNRNVERAWGAALRGWGYATFNMDSFYGRGITEVCTTGTLSPVQRIPDAYGALRRLAAHPQVDGKRIALMGFSHGGALTMLASTAWAKETYAPGGQPAFRAFFPFYPNCNADFPERKQVSAPLRIHTGEADDWTPAQPCAELAAALKASGQDAAITLYPGAHHAFDQAGAQTWLPNVNNRAACFDQAASILGPISQAGAAGCIRKGATVGGNAAALEQSRKNLRAQLDELMK